MLEKVSPSYMMDLIDKVEKKIWSRHGGGKYKSVRQYINKWHEEKYCGFNYNEYWENFKIHTLNNNIDLSNTLHSMKNELLFQIAVDLGIEVPNLIYGVPVIRGILSKDYKDANSIFEQAFKNVYNNPSNSVIMANSALESIIKAISKDN
ncbi:MAG: hypothetical protein WCJ33_00120, partial [Pseudomonadota bacterium]